MVITCNPGNYASRKTCEYAGGEFLWITELPENNDMRDLKAHNWEEFLRQSSDKTIDK